MAFDGSDGVSGSAGVTTDVVSEPAPRRRGRPPGSRNKVGAPLKELLAEKGRAGIEVMCKIAAGQPVYFRDKDPATGKRRKLVPDLAAMLQAQRTILDRLLPALKAQEISGPDGGAIQTEEIGLLDRARRIAFVLDNSMRTGVNPVADLALAIGNDEAERIVAAAFDNQPHHHPETPRMPDVTPAPPAALLLPEIALLAHNHPDYGAGCYLVRTKQDGHALAIGRDLMTLVAFRLREEDLAPARFTIDFVDGRPSVSGEVGA